MKKFSFAILLIVSLFIAGCVSTESDVEGDSNGNGGNADKPTIEILGVSTNEDDLNILRDQLVNNGFNVELNIQPDYGSFTTQRDAGNYDLALNSWTTVTGNPDYAVRSLFTSEGDNSLFADERADELIDLASTQLPEEYQQTYADLEQHIVFDNAYIVPLYISYKAQGVNHEVLDESTVRLPKSRAAVWEAYEFVDPDLHDSQALLVHQAIGSLTSLDPIKGNDGSINTLNTNMYVRLVNLTDEDQVVSDGSLSLNHVIAEGNQGYYFILRDDINFAAVEGDTAVDTGERVGAEDVKFSLDRAKDRNSVPDHRTYSLHESIDTVEIIDDLSELDVEASNGGTVREALEDGLDASISELTADKTAANNSAGVYQVVKVTTHNPFPQVLNYLAHQSAGIVSKDQVESINTFDVEDYDVNTDIAYGDQRSVTEGSEHENTLYASGPYILITKNDYEAQFLKNPGYMPGTDYEPRINEVIVKFIQDAESALSALRNNEIHILNGVAENRYDIVQDDDSLTLQQNESNAVRYLNFNMKGDREVTTNTTLRQAVLYSINQDEYISFYQGNKMPAVSTVSPLVDTGLKLEADPDEVSRLLEDAQ